MQSRFMAKCRRQHQKNQQHDQYVDERDQVQLWLGFVAGSEIHRDSPIRLFFAFAMQTFDQMQGFFLQT